MPVPRQPAVASLSPPHVGETLQFEYTRSSIPHSSRVPTFESAETMYSSIPAVDVHAAAHAPKRSYTRLAAVPAVMALLAFAGVAGYSQLKAQRVVTPARGMVTALAQTIAAKSQGDDYYAPDVSCTEMESVFNRCIDSEASFGGDYTCGDIATFALDYACNGTSALASGIFDYLVEVYEEIGICKELTKMMGHCFTRVRPLGHVVRERARRHRAGRVGGPRLHDDVVWRALGRRAALPGLDRLERRRELQF